MAQESLYLGRAHVLRVTLVMKQDEAPRPVYVGLFCTDAVVPRAQVGAQAIQQLGLLERQRDGIRSGAGILCHPQNFRFD